MADSDGRVRAGGMVSWLVAVLGAGAVLGIAACSDTGDEGPVDEAGPASTESSAMVLSSSVFEHQGDIPARYTCDGRDVSPPLMLAGIPDDAEALALVMDDPDAPGGVWDHWVAYDLAPEPVIGEDAASLGTPGENSWGRNDYGGPCPPQGTHRYSFTVYALDTNLGLAPGASKAELIEAMDGHVLAEATLIGLYARR